jgi:phosphoglycolate phosphatase
MLNLEKNLQAFQNLRKPDAIIYDWDNTLVDTWPLIKNAINETMRSLNREEWSLEKVRNSVHKSMRESFPEIFGNEWERAGEIYKKAYHDINIEQISLLKNSFELLNFVKNLNIPQFLVSNKIGTTLRKEVKKLQLEHLFFSLVGAQDANFDKPSREPADFALMGSQIDPKKHHIWFVGDTIADVECAHNLGACPIIYGHSDNKISKTIQEKILENGFDDKGAVAVYFDHQELINILKNLI